MYFALTDEQQELIRTVRSLVRRRADAVDNRTAAASEPGYDTDLWSALCEQIGVAALAVPEEYGGAGFTYLETHLVLEELGASLTPSPSLGSAVLATQALLLAGADEACARLLPDLAEGTRTAAVCWAGPDGEWATDSEAIAVSARDGNLSGRSTLVLDAFGADVLLVVASSDSGVGLYELDPSSAGVTVRPTTGVDQSLNLADVELVDARGEWIADVGASLDRLYAVAAIAVTALQVGAAQRALDLTVEYLKERVQFGRPLGSFQALKHRCADMLVQVEAARSISWAAAWAVTHDPAGLVYRAALAKAWCCEAFNLVASEMVQLHGGIAITWEHDAHLYFKRAHATSQMFGRAAAHRRLLVPPVSTA